MDYIILSKYSQACAIHEKNFGADSPKYCHWYGDHEEDYVINYQESSNTMETVHGGYGLTPWKEMVWGKVVTLVMGTQNLRRSGCPSSVWWNWDWMPGVRESCAQAHGHSFVKSNKARKPGRLRIWLTHQRYTIKEYRRVIINNVGDCDGMHSTVWATLFHCLSTDDDSHHTRCPIWEFYQKAIALDKQPGRHVEHTHHPLDYSVAEAMVPVYIWMEWPQSHEAASEGENTESQ